MVNLHQFKAPLNINNYHLNCCEIQIRYCVDTAILRGGARSAPAAVVLKCNIRISITHPSIGTLAGNLGLL